MVIDSLHVADLQAKPATLSKVVESNCKNAPIPIAHKYIQCHVLVPFTCQISRSSVDRSVDDTVVL